MLYNSHACKKSDLILAPALVEDDVHDNAGEAKVLLDHALELQLILLLLCSKGRGYARQCSIIVGIQK